MAILDSVKRVEQILGMDESYGRDWAAWQEVRRAAMGEDAEPAASLPCPSCGKSTATTIKFTLWQCTCGAVFDEDQATEASK